LSIWPLIALAAVLVVGLFVWLTYNRMVARRLTVENSWSQIDAQLRRRHDLIPNLVDAVSGYAAHERSTLERVSEARTEAIAAQAVPDRAAAEGTLGRAAGRLVALAESYPQLEESQNFSQLIAELSDSEDKISIARRVYNDTVETYNTLIQVFPAVLVARAFGFRAREFFDAPPEAETTPRVEIGSGGAG
jgi:LemA protein